jgi:hypothetical protein
LQAATIEIKWSDLEPLKGQGLAPNNPIDTALAADCTTPFRLRVLAGISVPDWVKSDSGVVNVTNPFDGSSGTIGQFWTDPFKADYDNLQAELALKYDSKPNLDEVVVSRCSMFYPEPFLRGTSIPSNAANLAAAGYSVAADHQCQQQEIDITLSAWKTARVGVSFNPYQVVNPDGTIGVDESFTEQVMAYCRQTGGQRCVLENDSIRDPISGLSGPYTQMYEAMWQLGPPLAFQTAVGARIGDFWGTLVWARQHHAASVELPVDGTYPTAGGAGAPAWQTLAEVAKWFQEDPVVTAATPSVMEGASTTGLLLADLSLDELAAVDTSAGYGDVGSVPFDTVSAMVDWPDGAHESAQVAIGHGPPAASATCALQQCTAHITSSGHTPTDEASASAAAVQIALSDGSAAFIPADGIPLIAAPAVSVSDQPLSGNPGAISASSGTTYSGSIGSFQDANALASALDGDGITREYSFSIDWGDGTALDTTSGTFTIGICTSSCRVQLNGVHTYARGGTYTVRIVIADGLDQGALSFTSTANVSGGHCTAATLSPAGQDLPPGTAVEFTAGSTGCNARYKFWLGYPNGTWQMLRDWGGPTYKWNVNPAAKGHFKVHVWANDMSGSQTKYEAVAESIVNLVVCASATLSPASITQKAGTPVAFIGGSTGCLSPQYEYWIGYPNGTWQVLRPWQAAKDFTWNTNPLARGTFTIHIWANNTGDSMTRYEAVASSTVTLTS